MTPTKQVSRRHRACARPGMGVVTLPPLPASCLRREHATQALWHVCVVSVVIRVYSGVFDALKQLRWYLLHSITLCAQAWVDRHGNGEDMSVRQGEAPPDAGTFQEGRFD